MTDQINSIIQEVDYKNYCRRLYNGRYLWEDLYQEFLIKALTEFGELRGVELRKYCFRIIKNLFLQKERGNSSLKELCSDNELIELADFNNEYTEMPDLISEHPTLGIKNMKTYCRDNRISYEAMKKKNQRIKQQLKQKYGSVHKA